MVKCQPTLTEVPQPELRIRAKVANEAILIASGHSVKAGTKPDGVRSSDVPLMIAKLLGVSSPAKGKSTRFMIENTCKSPHRRIESIPPLTLHAGVCGFSGVESR